jgi:hypothetical protein
MDFNYFNKTNFYRILLCLAAVGFLFYLLVIVPISGVSFVKACGYDSDMQEECSEIPVISVPPVVEKNPPTVDISANGLNPLKVSAGTAVNISWKTSNNPSSCFASEDWSGSKNPSGGSENFDNLSPGEHRFWIACNNSAGYDFDAVDVEVLGATPASTTIIIATTTPTTIPVMEATSSTSTLPATTTETELAPISTSNEENEVSTSGISVPSLPGGIFAPSENSGQTQSQIAPTQYLPENVSQPIQAVTATQCGYLRDFLKKGWNNDPAEIRKLQTFLRDYEGFSDLQVTGIFDNQTFLAVSDFQKKYPKDILEPWGYSDDHSTGFVYILTRKKINEIYCNTTIPLTSSQIKEIQDYRQYYLSRKVPVASLKIQPASSSQATSAVPIVQPVNVQPSGMQYLIKQIFTIPSSFWELFKYFFYFGFLLLAIYVISNATVDDSKFPPEVVKTKRIIYFIFGSILAILFSLITGMFSLVVPFILVIIVFCIYLLWITNKS